MKIFKLLFLSFSLLNYSCGNYQDSNNTKTVNLNGFIQYELKQPICMCFDGIGSKEGNTPIIEMKFSNGDNISICGFLNKEMEGIMLSEFNVFNCRTGKSLVEFDATQLCRIIEAKDSLIIQELKYLPTGKNWSWNLIQIGEQIITIANRKLYVTDLSPKLEKFFIDDNIAQLFLNSLQKGKGHSNDWELEIGKLEVLSLQGNEQARYILDNYEKFTEQETDGAVAETWKNAKAIVNWLKK